MEPLRAFFYLIDSFILKHIRQQIHMRFFELEYKARTLKATSWFHLLTVCFLPLLSPHRP